MANINYFNVPKSEPNIINSQQIQKILDENVTLIHTITDKQQQHQDADEMLKLLHKNLIYLATLADQTTSNVAQPVTYNNYPQVQQNISYTQPVTPVASIHGGQIIDKSDNGPGGVIQCSEPVSMATTSNSNHDIMPPPAPTRLYQTQPAPYNIPQPSAATAYNIPQHPQQIYQYGTAPGPALYPPMMYAGLPPQSTPQYIHNQYYGAPMPIQQPVSSMPQVHHNPNMPPTTTTTHNNITSNIQTTTQQQQQINAPSDTPLSSVSSNTNPSLE